MLDDTEEEKEEANLAEGRPVGKGISGVFDYSTRPEVKEEEEKLPSLPVSLKQVENGESGAAGYLARDPLASSLMLPQKGISDIVGCGNAPAC